jgi:hypothetical protein
VAGILVGAILVGPALGHISSVSHTWTGHFRSLADARYIREAETKRGEVSCHSYGFTPPTTSPGGLGSGYRYHGAAGTSTSHCNAALPDGAVVTEFRATMRDNSTTDQTACRLEWWSLEFPGVFNSLAGVNTGVGDTPGSVVMTDTDTSTSKIDNERKGYVFACTTTAGGTTLGFYGVAVDYEVKAAKGAAS